MATISDDIVRQDKLAKEQARTAIDTYMNEKKSIEKQITSLQGQITNLREQSSKIDTEVSKLRAVAA